MGKHLGLDAAEINLYDDVQMLHMNRCCFSLGF